MAAHHSNQRQNPAVEHDQRRCSGAVEEILHAPTPALDVSARADLEELKQAQTIRERNRQRIVRIRTPGAGVSMGPLQQEDLSISPVALIGSSFVPPAGTASSMPEYRPARSAFAIGIRPLNARKPASLLQLSCYRPRSVLPGNLTLLESGRGCKPPSNSSQPSISPAEGRCPRRPRQSQRPRRRTSKRGRFRIPKFDSCSTRLDFQEIQRQNQRRIA